MSKLLKFFIILSVALIILSNFSYAFAAVDMNLGNNTSSTNSASSTLSSTVTTSDCIALIVVGVLLILLGIAILIRLKR